MTTIRGLSLSNKRRQAVWGGSDKIDLAFRGLELGGEVGELQNLMKKYIRLRNDITGNTSSYADEYELLGAIAEELSDVIICASLIANDLDIDLDHAVPAKFDKTSRKNKIDVFFSEKDE